MNIIVLDASTWRCPGDFYSALLPAIGAPEWHGHNLNALHDSLYGDMNALEPPFGISVRNTKSLCADMMSFIAEVSVVVAAARQDHGTDVSFEIL